MQPIYLLRDFSRRLNAFSRLSFLFYQWVILLDYCLSSKQRVPIQKGLWKIIMEMKKTKPQGLQV